ILYPYLQGSIIKVALFTTLLSITLISSAYVLSYDRKPFAIALILGIPALLFTWLGFFAYNAIFAYASSIFTIAFYTFTLCMILSYVFNSKKIATAEIYGAVCVYLLMGITWGILY
ncbi:MAG: ion transporter, partial [Phototrophicales bacterium]